MTLIRQFTHCTAKELSQHRLLREQRATTYQRHQFDDAFRVFEDAVLAEDVGADELDVLRDVGLRRADARHALLDVVQQALGQRRVLVQVHQVRRLEGREARREWGGTKLPTLALKLSGTKLEKLPNLFDAVLYVRPEVSYTQLALHEGLNVGHLSKTGSFPSFAWIEIYLSSRMK